MNPLEQTEQQRLNAYRDAGIAPPTAPQTLTSANTSQAAGYNLPPTPQPTQYDLSAIPLPNVNEITRLEDEGSSLENKLLTAMGELGQKGTAQLQKEASLGLPEYQKQLTDVSGQIQALQKEAMAIPLQLQEQVAGRGVTAGGLAPIQTSQLRQNAIKALGLSSIAQTLQGNVALAQQQADRAIQLQFEPVQAEIDYLKTALELNATRLDREDKKRAELLRIQLDERQRLLTDEKETKRAISNVGMKLAEYGVDTATIQDVLNSTSLEDAIARAGSKLSDPKAKMELESMRLDMLLRKAQIAQTERETALLGEPTPADKEKEAKALATSQGQIDTLSEKINLIDLISSNKDGMAARVGPNILSRKPTSFLGGVGRAATVVGMPGLLAAGSIEAQGKGQQFAGGVHKLASREFLDALIGAKQAGATFGALTDREGDALRASATQLNDWEIKDSKGLGTGVWNIDEASFKRELDNIKRLAQKAIIKSQGTVLDSSESSTLDDIYNNSALVSPAQYY